MSFEYLIANQHKINLQNSSLIQCMLVLNSIERSREDVKGSRRVPIGKSYLISRQNKR